MENANIRELLKSAGFRFNKALGQNFIFDGNLLDAVAADSGIGGEDTVIEVGTGAGTLTARLAARAGKVISFEVDRSLQSVLSLSLKGCDNVEVVFRDVLKMSDGEIEKLTGGAPFRVAANLPYYVTTPLVMRFVESSLPVTSLTVMVQKEVADRMTAQPATPDYAALTLAVAIFGRAYVTRSVGRQMFYPAPNVDSAVVRIDAEPDKLSGENIPLLKKTVRAAFAMRRKTLANNLQSAFAISKQDAQAVIESAGFSPSVRGEALSLDDFVALTRALEKKIHG